MRGGNSVIQDSDLVGVSAAQQRVLGRTDGEVSDFATTALDGVAVGGL